MEGVNYVDAIILGIVQGATEFIPVSSSGHLVIFSHILGTPGNFAFDVLLNVGTLVALIVFYRVRIKNVLKRAFIGNDWRLLSKLVVATIPAFVCGLLFGDYIKILNDNVWIVIMMLTVVGVLFILFGNQKNNADDEPLESSATWQRTVLVGAAQAFALIPGTSRSGITILTGLRTGFSATRAAEFSFMLALPTIAGATIKVLVLDGGWTYFMHNTGVVLAGNAASFISGFIAVGFLIKLLGKRGLKDFGIYRICLALVLSALLITGII